MHKKPTQANKFIIVRHFITNLVDNLHGRKLYLVRWSIVKHIHQPQWAQQFKNFLFHILIIVILDQNAKLPHFFCENKAYICIVVNDLIIVETCSGVLDIEHLRVHFFDLAVKNLDDLLH